MSSKLPARSRPDTTRFETFGPDVKGTQAADMRRDSELLFEHVWATRFRDAVVGSGGELVASIRIPKEAIDEVLAAG